MRLFSRVKGEGRLKPQNQSRSPRHLEEVMRSLPGRSGEWGGHAPAPGLAGGVTNRYLPRTPAGRPGSLTRLHGVSEVLLRSKSGDLPSTHPSPPKSHRSRPPGLAAAGKPPGGAARANSTIFKTEDSTNP